jgi:hypothetical protein
MPSDVTDASSASRRLPVPRPMLMVPMVVPMRPAFLRRNSWGLTSGERLGGSVLPGHAAPVDRYRPAQELSSCASIGLWQNQGTVA